jgi:fatty-acyl-CoA synthase
MTTKRTDPKAQWTDPIPTNGYWINNWIARHADINPNQLILIDEKTDRRYTYETFNERTDRVAAFLKRELGIRKGDRVAMISWNRAELLSVLFATAKLGGIFVPINTRYTSAEIQEYLKLLGPKILVYEEEFTDRLSALDKATRIKHFVHIGPAGMADSRNFTEAEHYPTRLNKITQVDLEDPLMILQTGGTTGKPKGSIVNYRMAFWNALVTLRDLIVPGEITVTCVPLFHIGGYTYTLPLLIFGGTNILMHRWNPERLVEWIETERATFQFLVPAQLKMFIESPRFKTADLSSLRWFTTGGAALTREIVDTLLMKGVLMKQGYGLTEAGPGLFALDPKDALRKLGSIGKPNLLIDVRILGEDGKEAGAHEPGELLIRAPSLFGGYWKDPQETAKATEGGWFHTGDIVKHDDEGFYYIVGRAKRVIRSGSESIYPEEIERILASHPKVYEAVVIGVPDAKWGEVPKALVVLRHGASMKEDEVVDFCTSRLARYKAPKAIEFIGSVPRTPAGKISEKELMRKYGNV